MRLKEIVSADFRKNEATLFEEHNTKKKWNLRGGEVVCFLSLNRDQIAFVFAPRDEGVNKAGNARTVFYSQRLRIRGGRWDPLMLQNYAMDAGIELDGIKRFEEHYKELSGRDHE